MIIVEGGHHCVCVRVCVRVRVRSQAANVFSPDSLLTSGPIISDITEVATPLTMVGEGDEEVEEEEEEEEVDTDHLVDLRSVVRTQWSCWCHRLVVTSDPSLRRVKPAVSVKEEPSSPGLAGGGVLPVDTPLSPTTFINSILQEETTPTLSSTSAGAPPTTGHNKYHSACVLCCVWCMHTHACTCFLTVSLAPCA